jgi:hypothetical protein
MLPDWLYDFGNDRNKFFHDEINLYIGKKYSILSVNRVVSSPDEAYFTVLKRLKITFVRITEQCIPSLLTVFLSSRF